MRSRTLERMSSSFAVTPAGHRRSRCPTPCSRPVDMSIPPWPGRRRDPRWRDACTCGARPGPADADATAVYVHGLGGSATNWTDLAAQLSTRVPGVSLDLPGFGRSEPPRHFDYSIPAHADAVARFVARPRTSGPGAPVRQLDGWRDLACYVAARPSRPGPHADARLAGGARPAPVPVAHVRPAARRRLPAAHRRRGYAGGWPREDVDRRVMRLLQPVLRRARPDPASPAAARPPRSSRSGSGWCGRTPRSRAARSGCSGTWLVPRSRSLWRLAPRDLRADARRVGCEGQAGHGAQGAADRPADPARPAARAAQHRARRADGTAGHGGPRGARHVGAGADAGRW